MTRRLVLLDRPARAGSPWLVWARRMGIDPCRVYVPGWVMADDTECLLTFTAVPASRTERIALERVQLEAPALPFPVGEFETMTGRGLYPHDWTSDSGGEHPVTTEIQQHDQGPAHHRLGGPEDWQGLPVPP